MLQQTGVGRVIPKYEEWLVRFPDIESLAKASLGDVLKAWQGLGYNRRAKYVWEAARILASMDLPESLLDLPRLPGVGVNTRGAIVAYVDNAPIVFVETNIRTVFLHDIEKTAGSVADSIIASLVQASLPQSGVREWYWALMDYGSFLKQNGLSHLPRAMSYSKQSPFEGSLRQLRGRVIRELATGALTRKGLSSKLQDERLELVLSTLIKEGMVVEDSVLLKLP